MAVVSNKEFWQAKCNQIITKLEYGALTYEEFLDEMVRLGFDQQDIEELLEEEDEWLQRDRKNFI